MISIEVLSFVKIRTTGVFEIEAIVNSMQLTFEYNVRTNKVTIDKSFSADEYDDSLSDGDLRLVASYFLDTILNNFQLGRRYTP